MKTSGKTALIVSGMLALGLSACGGGDSKDGGSTKKATTLTPPGTTLAVGESATVGWVPGATLDPTKDQPGYKLEVTVDSIEQGDIADLADAGLTPEQKKLTPTFVKFTFKALEDAPTESDNPRYVITVLNDQGQPPAGSSGDYEACSTGTPPVPFKAGMTFEDCSIYLLPAGQSIASADWNNGPTTKGLSKYGNDPIVWSAK